MIIPTHIRPLLLAVADLVVLTTALLISIVFLLLMPPAPETTSRFEEDVLTNNGPTQPLAPQPAFDEEGKTLFANNCQQCHNTSEEALVGPGLKGIRQRAPSKAWLYDWIKNSSALIAQGDRYGKGIYEKFNKIQMTAFPDLTNQQIDAILDYVDANTVVACPAGTIMY
jgi:mono/diheme cytochrome c family protein